MSSFKARHAVSLFGLVCLAVVGVVWAQKLPDLGQSGMGARQLSSEFRNVAREVLPSIVSLETRGKAVQMNQQMPLPENHPFRRFFENDPQFRDFFERQQGPQEFEGPEGMGSGFIIDASGIIMTNAHVVEDAEEITVRLHDGREFKAVDWKADPQSDIAILRIPEAENLKPVKLGDSDTAQIGDWVLAFGAPFGLDMSVTAGIISGKGRGLSQIRQELLQTDAAINPGNSGGPLVNLNGEVIGINTAISTRSGGYDGVGFAIPTNKADWIGKQLVENGIVKRAFLGVRIQPVTNELAQQFQSPPGRGAIITSIVPDSPAADSALKPGDVILEMDGQQVNSTRSLQAIVEQLEIGKAYEMRIVSGGKQMDIDVSVRELPDRMLAADEPADPAPGKTNATGTAAQIGLRLSDITDDMRDQLGIGEKTQGVIVTNVQRGSPAGRAGISSGDIIEKVGDTAVSSVKEFDEALKAESLAEGVLLLVSNEGGRYFIVIKTR